MAPAGKPSKIDSLISEKYIPLDRKVKLLLAAAILLLPVTLYYFLFFSPTEKKIAQLKQQKTSLAQEVAKAKKAASNLKRHQEELAITEAKFQEQAVVLPKKKEIPELLRNISDLGRGAGLDFLSFKPAGEIPKDFYNELPVDISNRGPYHNMGYFLDQVSKLNRIVTVDNIKMGSPKQDGSEMLLESTCRLVTYRFTNTEAAKPKDKNKKGRK